MSVAKAFAARTITFLLDGLQGPTNREARESLERALADAERVRTAQLRAEVSEARADRDKAIAELEATNLRVAELESADALLDMSTPEHVVNAELRSIGVDPDALAERTLKFVGKVRDEVEGVARFVECIEVAERFPFSLGNVIKYVWRAGKKSDAHRIEDLEKARQYLEFEIDRLTRPE